MQLSFVDHDAARGYLGAHYTGVKSIFGDQNRSETLSLVVVPLGSTDPSAVDAALADLLRTRKTLYAAHGEIVLPMIADEQCGVVVSLGGLMLCLPRNACCGNNKGIFHDEENVLIALVGH